MSKRQTAPKLSRRAELFESRLQCDRERLAKAIESARQYEWPLVIAWVCLEGERIGWIQSNVRMQIWAFRSIVPRKPGRSAVREPYLAQILPPWAQGATLEKIFIDQEDLS